jgi:predicted PurR-regulated permease PerM
MENHLGNARRGNQPRGVTGMLIFLTLAMVVAALYLGREVLVPFALAILLSFLLAPAVRLLRRWRVSRVTAVTGTVLIAFLAIVGFGAIVVEEISLLAPELPLYQRNIEAKLSVLPKAIPLQRVAAALHRVTAALKRSETTGAVAAASNSSAGVAAEPAKPLPVEIEQPGPTPLQLAESVVGPLLQPLAMAGLVVVMVIFILLERESLRNRFLKLAGGGDLHRSTEAMNEAAERVSRYLVSQFSVNAGEGALIAIGLAVIGIPNAALWGIFTVLLRFVPYLGIFIAALFPIALAFAVDPGWSLLIWTTGLFIGVETIVVNVVEPHLYAGSTGLSSVAVISAAVFWTWLWGPIGLLLSTPLTACLLVLGRYAPQLRFLDVLLGSEPVLTPEEAFYQRLLAGDPEEATEQAEAYVKERSIDEFAEEIALAVLVRAQADSDDGILPPERREIVQEGYARILENLFEDTVLEEGPAVTADANGTEGRFAACLAGRNELDEAAAILLASLLRARGYRAYVFDPDLSAVSGENQHALRDAAVTCLSLISTSSPARARYIVRRLRRRAPSTHIVVGFWGIAAADPLPPGTLAVTSADAIVTTLSKAVATVEQQISAAPPLIMVDGDLGGHGKNC